MEENDTIKYKKQHSFFRLFLSQLFDISNSAGSIIVEAVNLFRTFQRLSATKRFAARFSAECLSMFKWATNLLEIILSKLKTKPFFHEDIFYIYTLAIPLFILTFIPSLLEGYAYFAKLIFYLAFLGFGCGFGYIGNDSLMVAIILPISGTAIVIGCIVIFYFFAKKRSQQNDDQSSMLEAHNTYQFSLSFLASSMILSGLMIPILKTRLFFAILFVIIIGLIIVISFIAEFAEHCCCSNKREGHFKKSSAKIVAFLVNCLSLLIIPSTECFAEYVKGISKSIWIPIATYIGVALIFPILTTFFMIKNNYSEICDKYKEAKPDKINWYKYIELIDIIRQIAYAIASSFDELWVCIGIEIAWVLLIFISRPFKNVSDYSLAFGSSLVMFMGNGVTLYSEKHDAGIFSFKMALYFVIAACIPAVISGYLFFIFDFDTNLNSLDDISDSINNDNIKVVFYISVIVSPIAWFLLGMHIPSLTYEEIL